MKTLLKVILWTILAVMAIGIIGALLHGKSQYIDQENYDKLASGMTLEECREIVGSDGKRYHHQVETKATLGHSPIASWGFQKSDSVVFDYYDWPMPTGTLTLFFCDGRLMSKACGMLDENWDNTTYWGAPDPEPWKGKSLSARYGEGDYHGDGANSYELSRIKLGMTPDQVRYVLNDYLSWHYLDTTTFESLPYGTGRLNTMLTTVYKPELMDPKYYGESLELYLVFSPEAKQIKSEDPEYQKRRVNEDDCRLVKAKFITMKEMMAINKAARERKKANANP